MTLSHRSPHSPPHPFVSYRRGRGRREGTKQACQIRGEYGNGGIGDIGGIKAEFDDIGSAGSLGDVEEEKEDGNGNSMMGEKNGENSMMRDDGYLIGMGYRHTDNTDNSTRDISFISDSFNSLMEDEGSPGSVSVGTARDRLQSWLAAVENHLDVEGPPV